MAFTWADPGVDLKEIVFLRRSQSVSEIVILGIGHELLTLFLDDLWALMIDKRPRLRIMYSENKVSFLNAMFND